MTDPDLHTREPEHPSGSLNHADFGRRSVAWAVRKSIIMMPEGKRWVLYLAAGFQVSLGLLDLLGIALIGLVAALGAYAVTGQVVPGLW